MAQCVQEVLRSMARVYRKAKFKWDWYDPLGWSPEEVWAQRHYPEDAIQW